MKTKKIILNFLSDVLPLFIVSFLGIFKLKIFIQILGDETLGLYQLFSQIMMYVALVDGGLSNAVLFSLYKPNSTSDYKKFKSILAGAYKCFSFIGMIVFLIAFICSFFVYFLINDCTFSYGYIVVTFLLFALSNIIGYFFVPYNCLLEVKEKKYINNLITQSGQIILSILEIAMLLLHLKFEYILIMHAIIKLMTNLVEMFICKKMYPEIKLLQKDKSFEFKEKIKPLIFHKINGLIGSNIDTIIISSYMGLKSVAIYSTYNYIINMLKNILGKIEYSMTAIVGNSIASKNNKTYDLFMEINSMLFYIAIIICVPLNYAINDFIKIWYENSIITNSLISISFVSTLFIYIIKMATTLFVSSAGLFEETKYCALTDTIVNLILSLLLVKFFGISGVLIATFISVFISEYILKTKVIHKNIFKKTSRNYFIKNIKFFLIYFLDLGVSYFIFSNLSINNIFVWFSIFLIFTIINSLIILILFRIIKESNFYDRFKLLVKKV